MVSPKKVHVQTTWNFKLQKIAQAVIKTRVTEVVKDMCDKLTTEWYPIVKFLARGGYLFFNWYLRLGKNIFYFLMVGPEKVLPRKTFLFGATPRHK